MDLHIYKSKKQRNISGTVKISGAKNSAVAIIPACLLTDEEVTLYNIPDIADVTNLIEIIRNTKIVICASFPKVLSGARGVA